MKKLIIASTSTLYNGSYLEYLMPELQQFFNGIKKILFIPYARPGGISHDDYTAKVQNAFSNIGIEVTGLHSFEDKHKAIAEAQAIFTGGGNTFLLVQQLYRFDLIGSIKKAVEQGTLYLGTSAGSNITGLTMETTNDMPIVYPPSFKTLGFVPFNINPHYLDPDPGSQHMGETRETRINEFHQFNSQPVIGLREGSWLEVTGDTIILKGMLNARVFKAGKNPEEIVPLTDLSDLK
ncbi:dipeptidase PepE [Myroides ceti]|uniref:Dipeptidase PepE n=1 Tax=Paenimyroides ceti TaxID=395087 RepID=A0ABT8CXZ2_9FLAO|nr:dipeptidase PepE [Paenimyroides ceti]MDN3708417.1 dipeptidase PepE [Paenimyroides ceti]